jgi:tRNA threonylcarbamoyladenosine biosynthesis protein TsaE
MKVVSKSVNETIKIGKEIARNLKSGDIICLFGELGSGKTVLVKGIAYGLGIKRDKIISPSFVLIREHHQGKLPLYHFDLYRLKSASAIFGLGYEEYFYDEGVTVIEWADRLKYLLPKEYLKINLEVIGETKRKIEITSFGKRYKKLLKLLKDKFPMSNKYQ